MEETLEEDTNEICEFIIGCLLFGILIFAIIGIPLMFKNYENEFDFIMYQELNNSHDTLDLNFTY